MSYIFIYLALPIVTLIMSIYFIHIAYSLITSDIKILDWFEDKWEYANLLGKIILVSGFVFFLPSTIISGIIILIKLFIESIVDLGFSSETALERRIYCVDLPEQTILEYLRENNIDFIIGKEKLFLPSKRIKKKIVKLSLQMKS